MPLTSIAESAIPVPGRYSSKALDSLYDELRVVNHANPHFEAQFASLRLLVDEVVHGLMQHFTHSIADVMLVSDELLNGVDLRDFQHEVVVFDIRLRTDDVTFDLYQQIADTIFVPVDDSMYLARFSLTPQSEWEYMQKAAITLGRHESRRISLLPAQ